MSSVALEHTPNPQPTVHGYEGRCTFTFKTGSIIYSAHIDPLRWLNTASVNIIWYPILLYWSIHKYFDIIIYH